MKAFQAGAKGAYVTALTARGAARKFFETYPTRRKCTVMEGKIDGPFFSMTFGRDEWPQSWRDVTKAQVDTLPDVAPEGVAA